MNFIIKQELSIRILFKRLSKLFLTNQKINKLNRTLTNRIYNFVFSLLLSIFESDDSADEYPEDNKELEEFKDKEEDEFSDSDKIPLNDLLEKDGGDKE